MTSQLNLGRKAIEPDDSGHSDVGNFLVQQLQRLNTGGGLPKKSTFADVSEADESRLHPKKKSETSSMEPEIYLDRPPSRRRDEEKRRLAAREDVVRPRHERPKKVKHDDHQDRRIRKNERSDDDIDFD
jgi:hypothetical protein